MAQSMESFGNYDLVKQFKLNFTDVLVSKWKSRVTGLIVVHLDYEAPIIDGYFAVATEIFNDSGCPHTLEHLVFMGSEKYPYKGILDILANRGFSDGTNAWTDIDHTAYTVSTAGAQGFLQLLPIYVDHILYPTITDSAFITEVHHIDGKGNDAGVVYSEIQGAQNTSGDLMVLRMQRLLDPPGSGYRCETGGLMEALRVLTADQIHKYHSSYYVPHNFVLIVTGKLLDGTSSLLRVVQEEIEPSLIQHKQNTGSRPPGWKRPFVETPSANRKAGVVTRKEVVEFPEKDESMGELIIANLGPPPNDFLTRKALKILGQYLTSSATAPLNKEYIEIESPLCSYINLTEEVRATHVTLVVYLNAIPTEHLDTFNERFKSSLRRIVNDGIDMQRMAMVINRGERQLRTKLESSKGNVFAEAIITDFLYGAEDSSELHSSMEEPKFYSTLRNWSSDQWAAVLSRYHIDQSSVVIIGKPSANLADELEKVEKARIAEQVKKLGQEGLKRAEKKLAEAKVAHNRPIPTDVVSSFPIPDVKSISWIPVQSVQECGKGRKPISQVASTNHTLQKYIESDGTPLSFFVEYDDVESDFVSIHAFFSLAKLPNRLRPYISVYLSVFFSLPVRRQSGVRLSHEEVVNQLDNDTASYDAGLGVSSIFENTFRVSIKVEKSGYETAIAWLRDLVYGSEFDKERIQVILAKIQQSLPELKRDGNNVLSSLWNDLIYAENSTPRFKGVLQQTEIISQLTRKLRESPKEVIADFETIRNYVTDPSGVRFSVTGCVLGVENPRSTWAKYFGSSLVPTPLSPVPLASQTLSDIGKNCSRKAVVMSLPTIESSFGTHTTMGVQGFDNPEYPAIRLATQVLNAVEGYLWRYTRGSGVAYHAAVTLDVEAGLLNFDLFRSSSYIKAFEGAGSVVRGLADGSVEFDEMALEAAKSIVVYGIAESVASADKAAMASFTDQALKGVSGTHQIDLLEKYETITKADILAVLRKHFLPLFDSATSVAVVVTAPGNAKDIGEGLEAVGFEVSQKEIHVEPDEDEDESNDESQ